VPEAGGNLAVIRAISGLGRALGLTVTAEGVETQEQLDLVRSEGCTEMQGFYFTPPITAEELRRRFLMVAAGGARAGIVAA
jgi:EAL domain-containing protein (putative c-di-GMP-specific phosphodiesterase class I)